MASQSRLPPKKDVALALLEQSTVFVHLDPRSEEVRVPAGFKRQPQLVLQIGYHMEPPIPDLEIGEDGISCTLSFSRSLHQCWIPWASVFALNDHKQRGMVWPDDVPREVSAQAAPPRAEAKPTLRAVPAKSEAGEAEVSTSAGGASAPAKAEKPKKKRARKAPAKDEAREARKTPRTLAARGATTPVEAKAPARGSESATGTTPAAGGDKRRRALPPYLRVIK